METAFKNDYELSSSIEQLFGDGYFFLFSLERKTVSFF